MISDQGLLRQYAEHGDEAAFAEVVKRRTDMVYSVALRVTRNGALAEDVTQGVFTQLARQAGRLSHYDTLIGWLHTASRNTAIDAIRAEERRRVREYEATAMQNDSTAPETNWESISSLLDEAVGELHEEDRKAVLLRFFENLSHREVGVVLGLSENSANKRVERALERLREYFSRRGVRVSSVLLAAAMAENSVQAAPVGLAARVIGSSLAAAAEITTGGLFLKFLFMSTKTKLLTAAVILAIAVIVTLNWPPHTATGLSVAPRQSELAVAAQVAQPALPAVKSSASSVSADAALPAASTPTVAGNQGPFVAGPHTDLNSAIAAAIYYAKSQDVVGYAKTLFPADHIPQGILALTGESMTLDKFAAKAAENPQTAQFSAEMLQIFISIQSKTPSLNDDGTSASFPIDPPVEGHKALIFNKISGFWYLAPGQFGHSGGGSGSD